MAEAINSRYKAGLGRLRFPIDHSPFHRSKVKFQAVHVKPPGVHMDFRSKENGGTGATGESKKLSGSSATESVGLRPTDYMVMKDEVANIHMPIGFSVSDNLEYQGVEFNQAPLIAAAGALEAGNPAFKAALAALTGSYSSFFDFFTGNIALNTPAATLSALRTAQATFGLGGFAGVQNVLSVVGRVSLHPNLRNRFTGVSLRSFSFAFKFLPKSPREALEIKKIVKFFRFHAYPEQIPQDTSFGVGYEYPSLFKIQLLSGAGGMFKNVGTPIKYSYLRSVTTTYNPNTPVLHPDGSPIEVDLTLTFVENKTLKRNDIRNEESPKFYEIGNQAEFDLKVNEGETVLDDISNRASSIASGAVGLSKNFSKSMGTVPIGGHLTF